MAFTPFAKDMNIIQALADEPNDVGGMTAAQLKAKFDEGGLALKSFINSTLLEELAKAANIPGVTYVTTAPTAANTDGIKVCVLAAEPATRYSGWLYITPTGGQATTNWASIVGKPFSSVGSGLKVEDGVLMLDAEAAAGNSF